MRSLLSVILSFCIHLIVFAARPADPPTVPSNIEICGIKLRITDEARREIQKDVNALRASDKYFQIKLDRVNLFFPIIERVLREEGVPDDLKYLSVQESALISDAVSTSDAVGFWQFKDFTAKEVGLRVDQKVDERKNIVSATRGAARYFKRNNLFLSNWIYAVNAYMTGPGGVKPFVDQSNFGKDRMDITKKTHWYVLRFIAHVIAFKDEIGSQHSEGLRLMEYTQGVNKELDQIAAQFNIDKELVREYNKWLKHGRIPDDKPYTVIVPVSGKGPKSLEEPVLAIKGDKPNAMTYPTFLTEQVLTYQSREVKINNRDALVAFDGDNLESLSAKGGLSVRQFKKYNDLRSNQKVQDNQIYYTERKRSKSPIRFHVVQYNESLWEISQKYGIRLSSLAHKNQMNESDRVKPGRLLWLRKKRPADTRIQYFKVPRPAPVIAKPPATKRITVQNDPPPQTSENTGEPPVKIENKPLEKVILFKYHPVNEGETLRTIALHYGIDFNQLMEWNELSETEISPGQNLRIKTDKEISPVPLPPKESTSSDSVGKDPPGAEEQATEPDEPRIEKEATLHLVQSGESLWGISGQYQITVEDLMAWNDLKEGESISPGQQLAISGKPAGPSKEPASVTGQVTEKVETRKETVFDDTHVVKAGESLWGISRQYDVTVEELRDWNQLPADGTIKIGQTLRTSSPSPQPQAEAPSEYKTIIVKPGDNLYKISRESGMTVEELMKLNQLESTTLSIGDELKVKKN